MKVELDTSNIPFEVSCPPNKNYEITLTSADTIREGLDFGLKCKTNPEYGVSYISADRFRPNWLTKVYINAGDIAKSFFQIDCGL